MIITFKSDVFNFKSRIDEGVRGNVGRGDNGRYGDKWGAVKCILWYIDRFL